MIFDAGLTMSFGAGHYKLSFTWRIVLYTLHFIALP
jgi:hypothetical protein